LCFGQGYSASSGSNGFSPSFPPGPLINPFPLCTCCFPPPLRSRASLCGGCSSSFRCPRTAVTLPLRGLRAAARDKERVMFYSGGKEGGKPTALRFTQPSLRWPPCGGSMALTRARRGVLCLYSHPPMRSHCGRHQTCGLSSLPSRARPPVIVKENQWNVIRLRRYGIMNKFKIPYHRRIYPCPP
jgi:hypothetical protein